MSGQALWRAGLDVSCSIKKTMAIVHKLDAKVVNLGKNLQVLGYASGKTIVNFIQIIDIGMYNPYFTGGEGSSKSGLGR